MSDPITGPASLSAAYHAARTEPERTAVLRCMARRAQQSVGGKGFEAWMSELIALLTPPSRPVLDGIEMRAGWGKR
jgi:hypothetical protein